jgi:pentatricopeptide repeat protein
MSILGAARAEGLKLPMSAFAAVSVAGISSRRYEEVIKLRSMAESDGLCPHLSNRFVMSLLQAYCRMDRPKEACETIEECLDRGLKPDMLLYTCAFRSFALADQPRGALRLLQRMEADGLTPDGLAVNAVIDSLSRSGLWKEAIYLLGRAEAAYRNSPPSLERDVQLKVAFNMAATACARADRMQTAGIAPDVQTYNAVLSAHGAAGEVKEAEALLQGMAEAGIPADLMTYNNIMHAYAQAVDCDDVEVMEGIWGVFQRIREARLSPNNVTFNIALKGAGRTKKSWSASRALLQEMKKLDLTPDLFTYSSAIANAASTGEWKQALSLLRVAESRGLQDAAVYTGCIRSLSTAGMYEEALTLFERMSIDCKPDVHAYTAIISACARAGEIEHALGLWEKMRSEGLKPTAYTFAAIIDACGRSGDADTAYALFQLMRREGVEADEAVYNVMVAAMAEGGKPVTARLLLQEMRGFGHIVNGYTKRILRECFAMADDDD